MFYTLKELSPLAPLNKGGMEALPLSNEDTGDSIKQRNEAENQCMMSS